MSNTSKKKNLSSTMLVARKWGGDVPQKVENKPGVCPLREKIVEEARSACVSNAMIKLQWEES